MHTMRETHALAIAADALAPLRDYLEDANVSEIAVNGGGEVWTERAGIMQRAAHSIDDALVYNAAAALGHLAGRDVAADGTPNSLIDARFRDLRVAAVLKPIALDGHVLALRRHSHRLLPLSAYLCDGEDLAEVDNPDAQDGPNPQDNLEAFLSERVKRPTNILVAGGTSTGKTTLLNSLIQHLPADERVVSIEDTAELQIASPNRVRLEAKAQRGVTIRDLVKMTLRLRPDRLLIGEVRGPEAFDLLQALNTGHSGMGTIHANSAREALTRLATLALTADAQWPYEAIARQIADTFDLVIHLARVRGKRVIREVAAPTEFADGTYRLRILWPSQPARRQRPQLATAT
jgi:Flp pilus assembly CpaF family ATPase